MLPQFEVNAHTTPSHKLSYTYSIQRMWDMHWEGSISMFGPAGYLEGLLNITTWGVWEGSFAMDPLSFIDFENADNSRPRVGPW